VLTTNNATGNGNSGNNEKKDSNKKKCPCGCYCLLEKCYYLNLLIRPVNWVLRKEKKERVEKALKNEDFKKKVQQAIEESKKLTEEKAKESPANSSNAITSEKKVGFIWVVTAESYSILTLLLQKSYILDSGSTVHIYND
jgi:hypothetical protein